MSKKLAISFVHGYSDLSFQVKSERLPSLWIIDQTSGLSGIYKYPFPRNPEDFEIHSNLIVGMKPLADSQSFKRLPRFGLTGISEFKNHIYCGSWNGVYKVSKDSFCLESIITHSLMNDLHGIWVDDDFIVTVLTGKDVIVFTDFNGSVIDYFSVLPDLTVEHDEFLQNTDWRFISKQFRGSTGFWHFNYVQRINDELWLTSRNASAFVVVNLLTRKCKLRLVNYMTPTLIHDGRHVGNQIYLTSIDGKIIIVESAETALFKSQEGSENEEMFNRDLVCKTIRLSETEFGREPNWCRGIECSDDVIYSTVDGRYGTDLSFGVIGIKHTGEKVLESRLRWKDIGSEKDLRYVTGFDVSLI